MRVKDMSLSRLLLVLTCFLPGHLLGQEAGDAEPADVKVTGDYVVEAGTSVKDLLVVGGDLTVRGRVIGDVVVIGGDIILDDGGTILGDASVTGGRILEEGGTVDGEMRTIDGSGIDIAQEIQRALGDVAAPEAPRASDVRQGGPSSRPEFRGDRPGSRIWRGLGGLIATLAFAVVLAGVGTGLVFYARPYLETVSDTIRGATLRSAGAGLAATFLAVPAFVVLVVALAVSIVGIPLLLIAVPLYPLALFAAFMFGLLAVAHAVGERTAEQTGSPLDLRYRNSYAYLFTGVAMLMTPLVAAHLIGMTGFLGFIAALLKFLTGMAIWACCTVGLGAVILSRGGRRRTFVPPVPDVTFDSDDLFDESLGGSANA